MTDIQEQLRNLYASQGIIVPNNFKFPVCDHPIEKWCSNCDRDYVTYDKIPHFRKYKELHFFDIDEHGRISEITKR